MSVVALLVARMGSSRLPGKALLPVAGRPMLTRLVERIRRSSRVNRVVLTTTTSPADDAIEALAEEIGDPDVVCYRGSPEDVLGRIAGALRAHPCKTALQLLGDNPLVHSTQIDEVLARYDAGDADYVVTAAPELPNLPPGLSRFPTGVRVEAMAPELVQRCADETVDPYHREHSTSFIHRSPGRFRIAYVEAPAALEALAASGLSLAVNYRRDYELICRLFERLHPGDRNFPLESVAAMLAAERQAASAEPATGTGKLP